MFIFYNPNPRNIKVTDCTIRAISLITHSTWDDTYISIATLGFEEKNMMDANVLWGKYLYQSGFDEHLLPDSKMHDYTIKDFCRDHPEGEFMLTTGSHVVTVINGNYYDVWDSGDEIPISYWLRREEY